MRKLQEIIGKDGVGSSFLLGSTTILLMRNVI